jgi:hypothetical protein
MVHDTVASESPAMLRTENDNSFQILRNESFMKVRIICARVILLHLLYKRANALKLLILIKTSFHVNEYDHVSSISDNVMDSYERSLLHQSSAIIFSALVVFPFSPS